MARDVHWSNPHMRGPLIVESTCPWQGRSFNDEPLRVPLPAFITVTDGSVNGHTFKVPSDLDEIYTPSHCVAKIEPGMAFLGGERGGSSCSTSCCSTSQLSTAGASPGMNVEWTVDGRQERKTESESVIAAPDVPPVSKGSLSCDVPDLIRLAEKGKVEKVQALLEAGEDPNQKDHFDLTALHVAAKKGHNEVISLLLTSGALVNACAEALQGQTPLHYACKYGRENVVYTLLAFRADPALVTRDGMTALQFAQDKKNHQVEAILEPLLYASELASAVAYFACKDD